MPHLVGELEQSPADAGVRDIEGGLQAAAMGDPPPIAGLYLPPDDSPTQGRGEAGGTGTPDAQLP
jgi:hypothetical protein